MKILAFAPVLAFAFTAAVAHAEPIDASLQAVITSPLYPAALAEAAKAVRAKGDAYVLTLGETNELHINGPKYYFYIPAVAVRVPLSPDSRGVGSIVALLQRLPNDPMPAVSALYFEPAAEPPSP
jgi:hypothetical protein